jgi:hypothetical protein
MKFAVDLSDVAEEFQLLAEQSSAMTKSVLDAVTIRLLANWKRAAGQDLKSTRAEYVRSVYWSENTNNRNVLALIGNLPNMIESGAQPFDIKNGFEKSGKIKRKKDGGWYLTIPFRIAAPGSLGENSAFSGVMGQDVHVLAKQLKPRKTVAGASSSGQSLPAASLPPSRQILGTRKATSNALTGQHFPEYRHKSPLHAGMRRNEKTYAAATQNTYNTFRRVSDKSDPNSWIHSGIKARNFAEQAFRQTDFDTIVNNSIDKFLDSL